MSEGTKLNQESNSDVVEEKEVVEKKAPVDPSNVDTSDVEDLVQVAPASF